MFRRSGICIRERSTGGKWEVLPQFQQGFEGPLVFVGLAALVTKEEREPGLLGAFLDRRRGARTFGQVGVLRGERRAWTMENETLNLADVQNGG